MLLQSSAAQIPSAHSTESPRAHTAICLVCALRRPKLGQTCRAGHGWSVVFDLHPRSRNHHGSTLTKLAKEHGLVTERLDIGGRSGNFRPTFWKVPVTAPSLTAERQIRSGGGKRISPLSNGRFLRTGIWRIGLLVRYAVNALAVASKLAASATFNTCAVLSMRFIKPLSALPGPNSMKRVKPCANR